MIALACSVSYSCGNWCRVGGGVGLPSHLYLIPSGKSPCEPGYSIILLSFFISRGNLLSVRAILTGNPAIRPNGKYLDQVCQLPLHLPAMARLQVTLATSACRAPRNITKAPRMLIWEFLNLGAELVFVWQTFSLHLVLQVITTSCMPVNSHGMELINFTGKVSSVWYENEHGLYTRWTLLVNQLINQ